MASEVMTRPPSSSAHAAEELQATLIELIDLALQGKQAHWNVTGPLFRSVHLELDEIVETARWAADEVAERMATLGLAPDGRPAAVADARAFDALTEGTISTEEAVRHIGSLLEQLSQRLQLRISQRDDDLVTQGILIETSQRIDKHAWMLRAQRS